MELSTLKKKLAAEAAAAGICEEWRGKILNAPSREYLLTLAVAGVDFVIMKDYPSKALASEFEDIAPHYGLYFDKPIMARNQKRIIARGEAARGAASYTGFAVAEVYACRGARLEVTAQDYAFVNITVEAGAEVCVKTAGNATVRIYDNGGRHTGNTAGGGKIKIITR
jgi:hypothetical protein